MPDLEKAPIFRTLALQKILTDVDTGDTVVALEVIDSGALRNFLGLKHLTKDGKAAGEFKFGIANVTTFEEAFDCFEEAFGQAWNMYLKQAAEEEEKRLAEARKNLILGNVNNAMSRQFKKN